MRRVKHRRLERLDFTVRGYLLVSASNTDADGKHFSALGKRRGGEAFRREVVRRSGPRGDGEFSGDAAEINQLEIEFVVAPKTRMFSGFRSP